MVLSLAASSVVTTSLTEARLTRRRVKSAELNAAADAVANIVLLRLLSLNPSSPLPLDGTFFTITFANYSARVSTQDEGGKIDLNLADRDLLVRLMVFEGVDPAAAEALADRMLDWREVGVGKRLLGAKKADYRASGLPVGPRGGPFETTEELRLVLGVTRELFDTFAPLLTVYGQNALPNRDATPTHVIWALSGPKDLNMAATMQATSPERQTNAVLPSGVITIQMTLSQGMTQATRTATVRLTGILRDPFWVYQWR